MAFKQLSYYKGHSQRFTRLNVENLSVLKLQAAKGHGNFMQGCGKVLGKVFETHGTFGPNCFYPIQDGGLSSSRSASLRGAISLAPLRADRRWRSP